MDTDLKLSCSLAMAVLITATLHARAPRLGSLSLSLRWAARRSGLFLLGLFVALCAGGGFFSVWFEELERSREALLEMFVVTGTASVFCALIWMAAFLLGPFQRPRRDESLDTEFSRTK